MLHRHLYAPRQKESLCRKYTNGAPHSFKAEPQAEAEPQGEEEPEAEPQAEPQAEPEAEPEAEAEAAQPPAGWLQVLLNGV